MFAQREQRISLCCKHISPGDGFSAVSRQAAVSPPVTRHYFKWWWRIHSPGIRPSLHTARLTRQKPGELKPWRMPFFGPFCIGPII
ncbi:hypothetical protein FKM82_025512 [Ascaphus truei]